MNQFKPKWKFYRDELNLLPVRHEEWRLINDRLR